jgi:hypothetical protein
MTMAQAAARPPKLPFWRTVAQAYAAPFLSLDSLVRAAWLWLLLLVPLLLAISWVQVPMEAEALARLRLDPQAAFETPWQLRLISNLHALVLLPAGASIAVAWHRLILAGERPAGAYLRLDRSVWLYTTVLVVTVVGISLLFDLPQVLVSGIAVRTLIGALAAVLSIAAALVIGRLSLVLPAIALGRTGVGLGEAWRATHRNTWRLFWGPFVCLLLLFLPAVLLSRVTAADRTAAALAMTALDVISIIGGVIGVGFLSFAYRHFFPAGQPLRV